jgi:hypothetical protein
VVACNADETSIEAKVFPIAFPFFMARAPPGMARPAR